MLVDCTHLTPLCLSQELKQIASFHQFKHNEVWIVVDAHSYDPEHVLMGKVATQIDKAHGTLGVAKSYKYIREAHYYIVTTGRYREHIRSRINHQ